MFTATRWLAALLLFATHATADTWFLEPEPLPIVPGHTLAHVGDFTGDGRNDLLYSSSGTLRLLPGQPGGTFGEPIETQLGGASAEVRAADFNGDGALDVWQSRSIDGYATQFAILVGDGHGRFAAPSVVVRGIGNQFGIADFNRDGKADVANSGWSARVRVYFSGGVGDARVIDMPVPLRANYGLAVGDFDGDGWPDIAGTSPAAILWNEGGAGFVFRTHDFATRSGSEYGLTLAAGDIDGDGAADVVAHTNARTVAYFGHRDRATFGKRRLEVDPHITAVHLADLDGNGTADVIGNVSKGVAVLSGRRGGTLGPPKLYASDETISGVADVDRDGRLDIRLLNRSGDALWLRGNGDGTLHANLLIDACRVVDCASVPPRTEMLDVNGDRRADFVFITGERLTVLPSAGTADYGPPVITELGALTDRITRSGDVNGDGRADLVVHRNPAAALTTWQVLLGQEDGTFVEGYRRRDPVLVRGCGAADFDGDGNRDILDSRENIHYGFGNGAFGEPVPAEYLPPYFCSSLLIADLNADATPDLMAEGGTYLNRGPAVFEHAGSAPAPNTAALAELTDDRFPDAVTTEEVLRTGWCCYQYVDHFVASIWPGVGDGTFAPARGHATVHHALPGTYQLDFDGDGLNDVALGWNVLLGNGDGTFKTSVAIPFHTHHDDDDTGVVSVGPDGQIIVKVDSNRFVPLQTVSGESTGIATTTSLATEHVSDIGETVVARVTSTAPLRPGGAVRFSFGDEVVVVPVEFDTDSPLEAFAMLEWELERGISRTITAAYMGDRNFAPSAATMQQHLPVHHVQLALQTYDASGPETTFETGEQIRLTVSVTTFEGKPVTGGTIAIESWYYPRKLLATVQGGQADVTIDSAMLIGLAGPGRYSLAATWTPDDPDYYSRSGGVEVFLKGPPRKRSVRH